MADELQKILELQAESITDLPFEVPFEVTDDSMLPDGVTIDKIRITPLKVGTVLRITPLLGKIKTHDLEKISVNRDRDFDESAPELFDKYSDLIIEVICIGIHNRKSSYPDYMPGFLKENCLWKDLHMLLNAILYRMGTLAFIDSTTALMKVGPGAAETIALQRNLESWSKSRSILSG
jgi:hypothetical protein